MQDLNTTTAPEDVALTPAELMKKHNSNPNHIITDSEMKNLKVGDEVATRKAINKEIEEKGLADQNKRRSNPYDILDA
jgi:hypothetical protein